MRTIKFRGKRIDNKEWIYGSLLINDIAKVYRITECFSLYEEMEDENTCNPDIYLVDPKTVGQFTGLKDKNGVEIYEGDILKHVRSYSFGDDLNGEPWDDDRTDTIIGKVVFYPTQGWILKGKKTSMNDISGNLNTPNLKYAGLPSMISSCAEVIGTIHDLINIDSK